MSRFKSPKGKQQPVPKQQPSNIQERHGTFQCQVCDDVVFVASWNTDSGDLVWECKDGHMSAIAGFIL